MIARGIDLSNRRNGIENSTEQWLAIGFPELAALPDLVRLCREAPNLVNRVAEQRHNLRQRFRRSQKYQHVGVDEKQARVICHSSVASV
jgi:hypothetical protein